MEIRLGSPADLPEILAIERASESAAHWSEEEYAQIWDVSAISRKVLVAAGEVSTGEIGVTGFLVARTVAGEWELENIAVRPEMRGRGIGSELLRELLARVRASGGSRLMLEVRESNVSARKLYEKLGLAVSGRRRGYYGNPTEDAVLYDIFA